MKVAYLKTTNLRAMHAAEFHFQSGFNLIVGVNGVGKTSVLDALCACLSPIVKYMNRLRVKVDSLLVEDIRVGADAMTLECGIQIRDGEYSYLIHIPRESSTPQKKKSGMPREQVHETPGKSEFVGAAPQVTTQMGPSGRPLAILFSTRRAVPSERGPSKASSGGNVLAAFADAFSNRELQLGQFAAWMRVQEVLKNENVAAGRMLKAFENAVSRFLPGYSNLRVTGEGRPTLQIDRGTTSIKVRQLSDGERGTLALVLDLTRRLSQANPKMPDPAANAEAIVLIDELDLHLHPKWQRSIVKNLTTAFPNCQFIATTHSPQVVAAVEPEQVQLLTDAEVLKPDRTLGMDSNWILRYLMQADERPAAVAKTIEKIELLIGKGAFGKARKEIAGAKKKGWDLPEWAVLEVRMARMKALAK
jgi:predicted ATP-binding protein involved in virulence